MMNVNVLSVTMVSLPKKPCELLKNNFIIINYMYDDM